MTFNAAHKRPAPKESRKTKAEVPLAVNRTPSANDPESWTQKFCADQRDHYYNSGDINDGKEWDRRRRILALHESAKKSSHPFKGMPVDGRGKLISRPDISSEMRESVFAALIAQHEDLPRTNSK